MMMMKIIIIIISHRKHARKWKGIEQTNPMEPRGDEGSGE